ncbi:type IV pilus assembly protein PilM [Patescibacteria group bacterium]|nr:MAG: type IV pilus assembly protein PilM [Patescibacteria group bacterium]
MSIFQNIFSMFKSSDPSVLGIDIGSSSVKVVQIKKKKGRAVLETYGELALGPYAGVEIGRATALPTEKIVEALLDILKESKTNTKKCGISIPLGASLISFIKLPPTDPKDLATMIPIEARKYIPVPISEVALDWWVIPKEEQDFQDTPGGENKSPDRDGVDVLVVVIHNEAIAKYQEISQRTALEASFFEIEIFSTIRSVVDQGIQSQMIFDMGASSTKLYIIERGVLQNSHTISRGSQDITLAISKALGISVAEAETMKRTYGLKDPEKKELSESIALTLDFIFYEANRVLLNYQKKYNKTIGKVILTGGGVLLKGFDELAKSSLQSEVILGNPFGKVETPAFLEEVLKNAGPEFAVAMGIALRKLQEIE